MYLSLQEKRGFRWVNLQIFDHQGKMIRGDYNVSAWQFPDFIEKSINPFGTPGNLLTHLIVSSISVEKKRSCPHH